MSKIRAEVNGRTPTPGHPVPHLEKYPGQGCRQEQSGVQGEEFGQGQSKKRELQLAWVGAQQGTFGLPRLKTLGDTDLERLAH